MVQQMIHHMSILTGILGVALLTPNSSLVASVSL